jgi:uncharacterized protein YndB with AHSA1/START domain
MFTRIQDDTGYAADGVIDAPVGRVFGALTTLDGLAGWWTPSVTGTPGAGGEITFGFGDQRIVMRVERADEPTEVMWTCLVHDKFPDWEGTTVRFELGPVDRESTELHFHHVGLVPALECHGQCSLGWDHYLASLTAYAVAGIGSPWGTATWRPAPA